MSRPGPASARRGLRRCTGRRGHGRLGGSFGRLAAPPLPHAIALAFGRDDGRVMRQTIEQRRRQFLVAGEDRDPFRKGKVGRHGGGATLIAIADQVEEQFTTGAVERDEAQLVDLCGAPHKSTNATPAVMWSGCEPESAKSLPIRSLTSH